MRILQGVQLFLFINALTMTLRVLRSHRDLSILCVGKILILIQFIINNPRGEKLGDACREVELNRRGGPTWACLKLYLTPKRYYFKSCLLRGLFYFFSARAGTE